MAEATKALNQKLEVPQGAEFNPECSGSDKTMAVTASIEAAAAAATALSSSSSNGLNGIRTWYPRNNKGLGSKFQSARVRDKPEEGRRIRRPKRCGKNNLDEEVSPKSIINENTSSQKYRQLLWLNLWRNATWPYTMTGPCLKIEILAINYVNTKKQIWCSSENIRNIYFEWRIWELLQSPHRRGSRMHTNSTKS